MPVREKIRGLLSKSDRASAFSSSFLARNHNIDTTDPNYASSIASYADYTFDGQQPREIPNITECPTTQESEVLMKKFWGDILACYYPMSSEDLEIAIKQASRDCKVNCIHKGDNLHESNTEGSAFIYAGSERGRKRMLRKHSKREMRSNDAPSLMEATAGGPVVDGRARHMLMLINDGSEDSLRALQHCLSIMENTEQDHIIIYTPWNETLPHSIIEHHIQRSQKSIIGEHDSITLLKGKLRDAACAISHQFADVLEHENPNIDYTLLVPGTSDPVGTAAIIAAKYTVEWIVVGKSQTDEKTGRKIFDHFGSEAFTSQLHKMAGTKLIVV